MQDAFMTERIIFLDQFQRDSGVNILLWPVVWDPSGLNSKPIEEIWAHYAELTPAIYWQDNTHRLQKKLNCGTKASF